MVLAPLIFKNGPLPRGTREPYGENGGGWVGRITACKTFFGREEIDIFGIYYTYTSVTSIGLWAQINPEKMPRIAPVLEGVLVLNAPILVWHMQKNEMALASVSDF